MHYIKLLESEFNGLLENFIVQITMIHPDYCRQDAQISVDREDHFELIRAL